MSDAIGQVDAVFECYNCRVPRLAKLQNASDQFFFDAGVRATKTAENKIHLDYFQNAKKTIKSVIRGPHERRVEVVSDKQDTIICEIRHRHLIYRCVTCGQETYFLMRHAWRSESVPKFELKEDIVHRYPTPLFNIDKSIPESVAAYYLEALKCSSIQAFNAVATMARLTVDEIARLFEADGKDLHNRLKALKDAGTLDSEVVAMAQQIRELGRNGAHAEWKDVSPEESANAIYMLKEILLALYVTPAEREKRKIQGLQKKG